MMSNKHSLGPPSAWEMDHFQCLGSFCMPLTPTITALILPYKGNHYCELFLFVYGSLHLVVFLLHICISKQYIFKFYKCGEFYVYTKCHYTKYISLQLVSFIPLCLWDWLLPMQWNTSINTTIIIFLVYYW